MLRRERGTTDVARLTMLNSPTDFSALGFALAFLGGPMFDPATTALLRAVLDDVCADISRFETGARAHVASRILEAAAKGNVAPENLKKVGREALHDAPTIWRQ